MPVKTVIVPTVVTPVVPASVIVPEAVLIIIKSYAVSFATQGTKLSRVVVLGIVIVYEVPDALIIWACILALVSVAVVVIDAGAGA